MTQDDERSNRSSSRPVNRRKFLKIAGGGAALTPALAGCTGGGGGDGGSGDGGGYGGDGGGGGGGGTQTSMSGDTETVTVGAVYPLSGPVGETGQEIQKILNYTVENIVNSQADLDPLILAGSEGLPNLNNAKVEIKWADHRGDPGQGRAEAERMIQQEEVDLLYGAYHSSVSKTVSATAQRLGVPHVTGESSSPDLTERGLEWFWRTGPHDGIFTENMFDFLEDLNAEMDAGIETVGIIHEDTEFGATSKDVQMQLAEERGFEVAAGPIAYTAESVSSLSTQVQRIAQADPDILLPTSYQKDAVMLLEAMEQQDWYPDLVIAQDSGFIEPGFVERTGISNYVTSRSTYADDMTEAVPEIGAYNDFVESGTGTSFNGVYIRSWAGLLIALKAVDNAGSTDPGAIQDALNNMQLDRIESGLPFGVSFNPDTGQNDKAAGVIIQFDDQTARLVWPLDLAQEDSLTFPVPGWGDR